MSTILRINGLRFYIPSNDHRPSHIHVEGSDSEAVFKLHCPNGPPELRDNYGFSQKELGKIADKIIIHLAALCAAWRGIHGNY
jgi:hypothetical protein